MDILFIGLSSVSLIFGAYHFLKRISHANISENSLRHSSIVVLVGCDSGLGLSMAYWAHEMGYSVIAGCLDVNGKGASNLRDLCVSQKFHILPIDVSEAASISQFHMNCKKILESRRAKDMRAKIWAVIYNPALLIPGEFFWLTENQIQRQMTVNFWGAIKFVSEFNATLFENKARLIIVTSDCAEAPLPGMSVYAASKAALEAWCKALRYELMKYGVQVVAFHPGNFPTKSRILSSSEENFRAMINNMSDRDKNFYGNFFVDYSMIFKAINCSNLDPDFGFKPLEDENNKKNLEFLLQHDLSPYTVIRNASFSHILFNFLIKWLPQSQSDRLIQKVVLQDIKWVPTDY